MQDTKNKRNVEENCTSGKGIDPCEGYVQDRFVMSPRTGHEQSSSNQTLRSGVRDPLEACMPVRASICLCCPVCRWRPYVVLIVPGV
jgi:hypothetical protein